MTAEINVRDLEAMDRPALLSLWQEVFDEPVPAMLSQPFLRRFLAFELQARHHGGLSRSVRSALEKTPATVSKQASLALKPGSRLLREWNGVTHVVDVTDAGFAWNGKTWRSLSAIARAITGAHWSGPRFFGLGRTASR